jgi:uncharacterized membrane protein YhiD involved in acid resistance
MALSEDEQRILRQIEEELQNDSKFAQAVSPSGLYTHSAKTVRLAAVGLVLGLVLLVAAFVAFVGMLALLAVIERNARAMGKAGIQDMAGAIRKARSSAGRRLQ